MYGTRIADNEWEMNAVVDGEDVAGGQAGVPQLLPIGNLVFNNTGELQEEQLNNPINVAWAGTGASDITFEFGDAIADGGTGRAGTTQWNETTASVAHYQSQNGYANGASWTVWQSMTGARLLVRLQMVARKSWAKL